MTEETSSAQNPIRIRFFYDFGQDASEIPEKYKNMYNTRQCKGIEFVNDDSYTHAILLNTPMPNLKSTIKPSHVLGLAFEPLELQNFSHEFMAYANERIGRYFIGKTPGLGAPFEEHYSYMWHHFMSSPLEDMSNRRGISLMVSDKYYLPGHQYRWELARRILEEDLPVDIWGRGVPTFRPTNIKNWHLRPALRVAFVSDFKVSLAAARRTFKTGIPLVCRF